MRYGNRSHFSVSKLGCRAERTLESHSPLAERWGEWVLIRNLPAALRVKEPDNKVTAMSLSQCFGLRGPTIGGRVLKVKNFKTILPLKVMLQFTAGICEGYACFWLRQFAIESKAFWKRCCLIPEIFQLPNIAERKIVLCDRA